MVLGIGDGDEDKDHARHHQEERVIGYPPDQLFDVVAAVDFYEDFVPWCQRSEILIRKQEGPVEEVEAELEVGFKIFTESYTSHVTQERPRYVRSTVSGSNLFEYLDCLWEFNSGPTPNKTALKFRVDFQFRSPLYHRVANLFFDEVAARMVSSFERRCEQVYGPPIEDPVVSNVEQ
ncbi:hypothetical protein KFL_005080110 [Klebsormidium nitens]|uniref:Coenzyme Q-binding protein COQ10 START domain-containing protein n=1 Tax=Klebsormidium nitens TaxID=105231 RepID=A0A1Y1IGW3_KLENI|nr:hypothetical protein KFL_005080110 [Klebsormidium nitens]|eukprot:GAQ89302.1 hypothetical protein KFL_005080110 [Klebsormidium nitens]